MTDTQDDYEIRNKIALLVEDRFWPDLNDLGDIWAGEEKYELDGDVDIDEEDPPFIYIGPSGVRYQVDVELWVSVTKLP
jgi:hypothetical protein